MQDKRIQNEINHGKLIKDTLENNYWYWESPAGKLRWERRLKMLMSHITQNMQVLEVGCGFGFLTKELVSTAANITAIDISEHLMSIAKQNVKADNLQLKIENAYKTSFEPNSFDTIVGSSVLHHLDIDQALCEFKRVLKPKGTIYFTEPNMLNPQIFIERKTPFLKKWLKVSPDETAFIRWKLQKKMEQAGFINIEIINFDFLHPSIPKPLIPTVKTIQNFFEKIPIIKEISGSLYIKAEIA